MASAAPLASPSPWLPLLLADPLLHIAESFFSPDSPTPRPPITVPSLGTPTHIFLPECLLKDERQTKSRTWKLHDRWYTDFPGGSKARKTLALSQGHKKLGLKGSETSSSPWARIPKSPAGPLLSTQPPEPAACWTPPPGSPPGTSESEKRMSGLLPSSLPHLSPPSNRATHHTPIPSPSWLPLCHSGRLVFATGSVSH